MTLARYSKKTEPYVENWNVIVIRKSTQSYLKNKYNIRAKFLYHPFYPYKKNYCDTLMYNEVNNTNDSVSISRIDYYKNIDTILRANNELERPIKIYGSKNPEYAASPLDHLNFNKYYKACIFEEIL